MFLFYWLIAVMPLDQHWLWGREILGALTVIKLLGLLCLLMALFKIATGAVSRRRYYKGPQARWFGAFAVLLCLATVQTLPTSTSAAYSHLLSVLALFIIALTLIDSEIRLYRAVLVAIGAAAFASLYAIRQRALLATLQDGFRAAGIFSDANQYALVVGLWIPVAFLWAIGTRPLWERLFCFACLIIALLGTTFAASRGGFFGLGASFVYLVLRSRRPMRNLAIASALIIPLLVWSSSSVLQRLRKPSDGDQQAVKNRIIAWKAGMRMIRSHPLTGIGVHNFRSRVLEYEEAGERVSSLAHNTYLEIAAEMGIATLIAFIGLLGATFVALGCIASRSHVERLTHLSTIALGLQAGLLSYVVSAFFMSAWWERMFWLLIFFAMCLYRLSRGVIASKDYARSRILLSRDSDTTVMLGDRANVVGES